MWNCLTRTEPRLFMNVYFRIVHFIQGNCALETPSHYYLKTIEFFFKAAAKQLHYYYHGKQLNLLELVFFWSSLDFSLEVFF